MFKNGKSKAKASPSDVTVINRGTTVEGEIKVGGTIRIYGRLNGTVRSEGKVIIAENGVLSGDLYATAADVSGTVEGIIEAGRLDLRSTATVEGNVVVQTFTTETGAIFIGDCKMPQHGTPPSGDAPETAADEAPDDDGAEDETESEAKEADSTEKEAGSSNGTAEHGGVKPLPNKPDEVELQAKGAEASEQEDGDGRPRLW